MSKTSLTAAEIKAAELYGLSPVARITGMTPAQVKRIVERYGRKAAGTTESVENITALIKSTMEANSQK